MHFSWVCAWFERSIDDIFIKMCIVAFVLDENTPKVILVTEKVMGSTLQKSVLLLFRQ